jgi:hypothetical protein
MKDKIIRLLKAIGIALICFGVLFLFIFGFVKYTEIAAAVLMALIFIFVVWRIYKDADFL